MSKTFARVTALVVLPAWVVAFLLGGVSLAAFEAEHGDSLVATAAFIFIAACTGISSLLIVPVLLTGALSSSVAVRVSQAASLPLVGSMHLCLMGVAILELLQYGNSGSTAAVSTGLLLLWGVVAARCLRAILRLRRSSTEAIDQEP